MMGGRKIMKYIEKELSKTIAKQVRVLFWHRSGGDYLLGGWSNSGRQRGTEPSELHGQLSNSSVYFSKACSWCLCRPLFPVLDYIFSLWQIHCFVASKKRHVLKKSIWTWLILILCWLYSYNLSTKEGWKGIYPSVVVLCPSLPMCYPGWNKGREAGCLLRYLEFAFYYSLFIFIITVPHAHSALLGLLHSSFQSTFTKYTGGFTNSKICLPGAPVVAQW